MGFLEDSVRDIKYSLKTFLRSPGFSLAVVTSLALGIGANTAIFTVLYGVLLKPLPYADEDTLVALWQTTLGNEPGPVVQSSSARSRTSWRGDLDGGRRVPELSPGDFADIRAHSSLLDTVVAAAPFTFTLTGGSEPATLQAWRVTRGFFGLLKVTALHGRTFQDDEYSPGNTNRVVIIAHDLWRNRYGGDPDFVGREIVLNGEAHTVIGVMPRDFQLPVGGYWGRTDLWAPNPETAGYSSTRASSFFPAMARLRPGATIEQVQGDLARLAAGLAAQHPATNRNRSFIVVPLREHLAGTLRSSLLILFGAVVLFFLVACLNVANLLLVRSTSRRRELAVRLALGAGRGRIVRQLMAESAVLVAVGTAAGIAMAYATLPVLLALNPATSPLFDQVRISGPVLVFSSALGGLAVLIFGTGPAFRLASAGSAHDLTLRASAVGDGVKPRRVRNALVTGQIALAIMLLVGAAFTIGTFWNLLRVDPGFTPRRLLSLQLNLVNHVRPEARAAFVRETIDNLQALPGVTRASAVSNMPFHDTPVEYRDAVRIQGRPAEEPDKPLHTVVTAGYFETMGTALRSGRFPNALDTDRSQPVIVINETMARRSWPGQNPLGSRVTLGYPANNTAEVVGVVADVKRWDLSASPSAEVYIPHAQVPVALVTLVVRTEGESGPLLPEVRALVRARLPSMPLGVVSPVDDLIFASLTSERFAALLFGAFGAIGLLLAGVGLYGVMSFNVAARQAEIGLRIALGSERTTIFRMILFEGLSLWTVGSVVGVAVAAASSRLLSSMIFGMRITDVSTYTIVVGTMAFVTFLASMVPAYRAASNDPIKALKHD